MSSIESIVDSLEGKINKILNRVEVLQKENVQSTSRYEICSTKSDAKRRYH